MLLHSECIPCCSDHNPKAWSVVINSFVMKSLMQSTVKGMIKVPCTPQRPTAPRVPLQPLQGLTDQRWQMGSAVVSAVACVLLSCY